MDWSQPYHAARSPVLAANVVATSQPLAAAAGLAALQRGGNAVDAALATAICLTVVEPNNNGIGSDAFAMVWDGTTLHGLNASGRSPAAWSPERFSGEQMPTRGWDAVTVPGAVSAWTALSERFGRLAFEDLFAEAIRHADQGFAVGPKTAPYWQQAATAFKDFPSFQAHFCPAGRAPKAGDLFRRPELAATLAELAGTRGRSLYTGDLAGRIAAEAARAGAALTSDDLAAHQPEWVTPVSVDYRGTQVHELPPNGQGLAALIALGILDRLGLEQHAPDSAGAVHLQVEAMKTGIAQAFRHFADPAWMALAPEGFLDPAWLDQVAAGIQPGRAGAPVASLPGSADTVYLSCADADGMAVSFIQSNYMGFGSGVVIPGTGIAMQNRGAGFSLQPGHPNRVAGGKRPFHTIIPGFVTRNGAPLMSFGVMGGHMQHQGHVQMVNRVVNHQQNPQAASDAPRWHLYEDLRLALEPGFDPATATALEAMGHTVVSDRREHLYGGAQLVVRGDNCWVAGSDHRKEGLALGW